MVAVLLEGAFNWISIMVLKATGGFKTFSYSRVLEVVNALRIIIIYRRRNAGGIYHAGLCLLELKLRLL